MFAETAHCPARRWHIAALLAILLIAAAVRLYALGRAPLWLDEQCQLAAAQTPTHSDCWTMGGKLGPIGKLSFVESWLVWHAGGHTRAWLRFPAALWGIPTIGMVFVLGRRWLSASTGLFAAALLAVNGVHIQFSREARGYALLVFLCGVWAWMLDRFATRPTRTGGVCLFLAAEIALQVHPAFLIVVAALSAAMILVLLTHSKQVIDTSRQTTAIAIAIIAVVIGITFYLIPRELPISTENKPLSDSLLYTIADIYKTLLGGYWGAPSYAIAILAAIGIAAGICNANLRAGTVCAVSVSLAGLLPILIGHVSGAAVFARYSLFCLPFLMLLPAIGINALASYVTMKEPLRCLIAVLLSTALLTGMYLQGRSPYELEAFKQSAPNWPTLEH